MVKGEGVGDLSQGLLLARLLKLGAQLGPCKGSSTGSSGTPGLCHDGSQMGRSKRRRLCQKNCTQDFSRHLGLASPCLLWPWLRRTSSSELVNLDRLLWPWLRRTSSSELVNLDRLICMCPVHASSARIRPRNWFCAVWPCCPPGWCTATRAIAHKEKQVPSDG